MQRLGIRPTLMLLTFCFLLTCSPIFATSSKLSPKTLSDYKSQIYIVEGKVFTPNVSQLVICFCEDFPYEISNDYVIEYNNAGIWQSQCMYEYNPERIIYEKPDRGFLCVDAMGNDTSLIGSYRLKLTIKLANGSLDAIYLPFEVTATPTSEVNTTVSTPIDAYENIYGVPYEELYEIEEPSSSNTINELLYGFFFIIYSLL